MVLDRINKSEPRISTTLSFTSINSSILRQKQANDREAQRAIRQRTRENIEGLEKRIKELLSDNLVFKEEQGRNIELEEEVAWLQKVLG